MEIKEFKSLFNQTANQLGINVTRSCITRYSDKRKNHRRIKFVSYNSSHLPIFESMVNELKQRGLDVHNYEFKSWYNSYGLTLKKSL
jgi:hypothetical protein